MKQKGSGYLQISHEANPINEFSNADLFPMIYPTLYLYGLCSSEDCVHQAPLLLKSHVKHLLSLSDLWFQEHSLFLFSVFSILQWWAVLLQTSLKVKHTGFASVVQSFATVSVLAIHRVAGKGEGPYECGDKKGLLNGWEGFMVKWRDKGEIANRRDEQNSNRYVVSP